jgi:hypothetical protein
MWALILRYGLPDEPLVGNLPSVVLRPERSAEASEETVRIRVRPNGVRDDGVEARRAA